MTELTMHRTRISGQDWSGFKPGPAPTVSAPYEVQETTFVPVGEVERLRDFIQSVKTHGELANIPVGHAWGSSGKKPASKDVWCFPRHMLNDLDAALSSEGV